MEHFKAKIAIADDHEKVRLALKLFFEDNGFKVVIEAINGEDLIQKLRAATDMPDICVLDANMPVMDGCGAAPVLKNEFPDIKIIAFSDDTSKGCKMLRLGADDYLAKNSSAQLMIECVEKLIHRMAYKGRKV
jgi:DNA-binding NarL/FixJ family response regulator